MDMKTMFNLTYGLFVLTAAAGGKESGCIINTAGQVTVEPNQISITVNKANYTHDLLRESGKFNISILSEEASFDTFRHFGFQSGRDVDKFAGYESCKRSANGLHYVTAGCNGYISASVLFCVGAMTIMGAIQDGLGQGYSILLTKSSLDFIASIILAASLGVGVLCSALTVLLYQGGLTLLAGVLQGVLAGALLDQLCMVGYAIVLCIGINFFGVVKIKTASLLPALLVPLLYNVPMLLKTL